MRCRIQASVEMIHSSLVYNNYAGSCRSTSGHCVLVKTRHCSKSGYRLCPQERHQRKEHPHLNKRVQQHRSAHRWNGAEHNATLPKVEQLSWIWKEEQEWPARRSREDAEHGRRVHLGSKHPDRSQCLPRCNHLPGPSGSPSGSPSGGARFAHASVESVHPRHREQ